MRHVVSVQVPEGLLTVTLNREISETGIIVTHPLVAELDGKPIDLAVAQGIVSAELRRRQAVPG